MFAVFAGQKHWFLQCFVNCLGLTFLRENVKNLANSSVFGGHVVENVANCSVFDCRLKNTVNSSVLGHGKLKNNDIYSVFSFAKHKTTEKYGKKWCFWPR